jgi:hypothetical protein
VDVDSGLRTPRRSNANARLRADARGRNGGIREELAEGVGHVIEKRRRRPDSSILRSLRRIEAKLEHINERLDKFLSASKRKRAARTGDAGDPANFLIAGTPEHAKKLRERNPDATIIITGVPRPNDED